MIFDVHEFVHEFGYYFWYYMIFVKSEKMGYDIDNELFDTL